MSKDWRDSSSPSAPQNDSHSEFFSTLLEAGYELINGHFGLPENAAERTYRQLTVKRHDAADFAFRQLLLQNNVTSLLTNLSKPQALESANGLVS